MLAGLRKLELSFMYVAAWTLLLSRSEHLRRTVANKTQKNLRQGLITLSAWWRAVLLALAGHMSELLQMRFPSKDRKIAAPLSVSQWMPDTPAKSLLESRLQEDNILNTLHLNATAKVRTHSNLSKSGKANADGYFTALLQPKAEVTLALLDDSGNQASVPEPSTYSQKIWCAGHGELVQETPSNVESFRNAARLKPFCPIRILFSLLEVTTSLNSMKVSSASVGFPRSAIKAHSEPPLLVSWALINAIAALGAQPSFWFLEVGPYSKTGDGSCA